MISQKKERILWKISREAQEATRLKIESLFKNQETFDHNLKASVSEEMGIIIHRLITHLIDAMNTDGRSIKKEP